MSEHQDDESTQNKEWQEVASRIKKMASAKGMNLSQLGGVVGVSRSEVTRVTSGRPVKEATLQKYADALGVSLPYLRFGRLAGNDADALWQAALEAGRRQGIEQARDAMTEAVSAIETKSRGLRDAEPMERVPRVDAKTGSED